MFAISYAHKSIRPYRPGISEAGMGTSFTVSDELGEKIVRGIVAIEDAIAVYMTGKSPEILLAKPDIMKSAPIKAAPDYVPPPPAPDPDAPEDKQPTLTRSKIVRLSKAEAAAMASKLGVGGESAAHKDNVAALLALCPAADAPAPAPANPTPPSAE